MIYPFNLFLVKKKKKNVLMNQTETETENVNDSGVAKLAAKFVGQFEGFIAKPVWDVNAWRVGHGSDTITAADGSFRKVLETDTTTLDDADRDLARRIKNEFIPRIQKQITLAGWDKLQPKTKVALISFAYNYGSISKKKIRDAATAGDDKKVAELFVTETADDNKKLPENVRTALKKRRKKESEYILS